MQLLIQVPALAETEEPLGEFPQANVKGISSPHSSACWYL